MRSTEPATLASPGLWSFPMDGGLVLVRPGEPHLRVLNPSARLLWEALQREGEPAALPRALERTYGIPAQQAERDSAAILQQWRQAGLLEPVAPVTPAAARIDPDPSIHPALPAHFPVTAHYHNFWQPFRFRWGDADLAARVQPLLAPLAHAPASGAATLDLFRDGGEFVFCENGAELARASTLDIPLAILLFRSLVVGRPPQAQLAGLHAAGLAGERGALLLAGNHGSGKSTLAAALCQEGLCYLGDDLVPLLRDSRELAPLPGSLCLKVGSWPVLARRHPVLAGMPAYQRAGQRVRYLPPPPAAYPEWRGYPARLLVFPTYQPGAAPTLTPLSSLAALERLVASSGLLPSTDQPHKVGELLNWLRALPAFAMVHDNLEQAVARLLDLAREWL